MRQTRSIVISIILAAAGLGLLAVAMPRLSHAAVQPGDTAVPLGPVQSDVRTAYCLPIRPVPTT